MQDLAMKAVEVNHSEGVYLFFSPQNVDFINLKMILLPPLWS